MQQLTTDAIVLKSTPFKECDKILTLFSKEAGLIKLYVKGRRWSQSSIASAFTRGEYLCMRGKSELFRLKEARIIHPYLHLRDSLSSLLAAEKMGLLLQRLMGESSAVALYSLFASHLEGLKMAPSKEALFASFFLKALHLEGLYQLQPLCSKCQCALTDESFRFRGERWCKKDAQSGALLFSLKEEREIERLFRSSPEEVAHLPNDPSLISKIEILFFQLEHL